MVCYCDKFAAKIDICKFIFVFLCPFANPLPAEDEDLIIVEKITPYELVLRYREQLYTLSMAIGKEKELALERDVPVKPTHNWDSMWLRPPYTFTLVLRVSWKEELYGSSDRDNFHEKPHYVRTSDLPAGVRTMQQIDHDAWEEGVRSGQIGRH